MAEFRDSAINLCGGLEQDEDHQGGGQFGIARDL